MSKIYSYPLRIREAHLDTFGHVNNATYLTIFEEARWEIVTSQGYGLDKISETAQGPVILEIQIKFLKELRLRTDSVVKTQILSYHGKISKLKQWIEDINGEVYVEAEFVAGLFDLKTRKLIPPTPAWLAALGLKEQP
ncbi:MAG: thioesterase [Proteobacteria bacterium SG_bin7]|nr:MAG: thioesterase [Proteobacteria bacterium SG_bin7]